MILAVGWDDAVMTTTEQNIAAAELHGWTHIQNGNTMIIYGVWVGYPESGALIGNKERIPNYSQELDPLRSLEIKVGLHDTTNTAIRVRWINTLRQIVSKRTPKNKMGAAIISDVDLLTASATERLEALLKAIGKWKDVE